jgi:hypothetical protein
MPLPQDNGHGRDGGKADPPASPAGGFADVLAETEALRDLLHDACGRVGRLLAALKQQRRQARAVEAAVSSLRQLQLGR